MTGAVTVVDPGNPLTWLIAGRHPSPEQLELLAGVTPADFVDALHLLDVDMEIQRGMTVDSLRELAEAVRQFLAEH